MSDPENPVIEALRQLYNDMTSVGASAKTSGADPVQEIKQYLENVKSYTKREAYNRGDSTVADPVALYVNFYVSEMLNGLEDKGTWNREDVRYVHQDIYSLLEGINEEFKGICADHANSDNPDNSRLRNTTELALSNITAVGYDNFTNSMRVGVGLAIDAVTDSQSDIHLRLQDQDFLPLTKLHPQIARDIKEAALGLMDDLRNGECNGVITSVAGVFKNAVENGVLGNDVYESAQALETYSNGFQPVKAMLFVQAAKELMDGAETYITNFENRYSAQDLPEYKQESLAGAKQALKTLGTFINLQESQGEEIMADDGKSAGHASGVSFDTATQGVKMRQ